MRQPAKLALTAAAVMGLAAAIPASGALAQQKMHVTFTSPAENTHYTQQIMIDVGDTPGHQVGIYEIHRTYPDNAPVINGLKLVEEWTRGTSDYFLNNGSSTIYGVYVMENGDMFFTRSAMVAQSPAPGTHDNLATGTIMGGTGKFAGMQGLVLSASSAEPQAGVNAAQTDMDYWFDTEPLTR